MHPVYNEGMIHLNNLERLDEYVWEIPQSYRHDMRVPARIYASRKLLKQALTDKSVEQLINATTLPGIVGYAIAMPDVHQGYGFPVGGVAATRLPSGVISPGAIGYDINCGVRLLASDLTADELIARLREGKIYDPGKIETALRNFFQADKILQLRELALKEVASQVERKVDNEVTSPSRLRHEKFLACISSNADNAKMIIRKTARLASYYNSKWYVLYVQTKGEDTDRIKLSVQRHLINNFKMATEMGGEVIQVKSNNVPDSIVKIAEERKITTICMGLPRFRLWRMLTKTTSFNRLLKKLSGSDIDLVILS